MSLKSKLNERFGDSFLDLPNGRSCAARRAMNSLSLRTRKWTKTTYKISNSAKPRKACSSKHVISLLSICKLRNDVAPLNVFRPMICNELCDKSLLKKTQNKYNLKRGYFSMENFHFPWIGMHLVSDFSSFFQLQNNKNQTSQLQRKNFMRETKIFNGMHSVREYFTYYAK